jgi:hypothetical protein
VTAKDLFGNEVDLQAQWDAPLTGPRKKKRKSPIPRGHYYPPGTGPKGETCGGCKHCVRRRLAKTYIKCGLNRANWTGGGATDIRAKDPACKFWEKDETA